MVTCWLGESASPRDPTLGVYYMNLAAQQGLPAALEQLGRYYAKGTLVQQDIPRGLSYYREAAALGNLKARLSLAELLLTDHGSPLDYEDAYRWLYHTVTADQSIHRRIQSLRQALELRMPMNVIARAKRRETFLVNPSDFESKNGVNLAQTCMKIPHCKICV